MEKKTVFSFGDKKADGDASMKQVLGGKGAGLAEMTKIGLPVPAGFTISTSVCDEYYQNDKAYSDTVKKEVSDALALLEKRTG